MLVVIGSPAAALLDGTARATGPAAVIARLAAADGAAVQIVGRVGDDPTGDAVLLDLAAAAVGHVAVLRGAGEATPLVGGSTDDRTDDESPAAALAEETDRGEMTATGLPLDAADLELALRYLPDYRVIVVAQALEPAAMRTVVDAAGWSGARLVILGAGQAMPDDLPPGTTVLEPPPGVDAPFAAVVARYAAELDRGTEPGTAFARASAGSGWQPVDA